MIRIITGTRPQLIKATWLKKGLKDAGIDSQIHHYGQHYDENLIDHDDIKIDETIPLDPLLPTEVAVKNDLLEDIELYTEDVTPIVVGDCLTTLGAVQALIELDIPFIHLESGLRSTESTVEGIIRSVADSAAFLKLCPTKSAQQNLVDEGEPESFCPNVGDVMLDRWLHYHKKKEKVKLPEEVKGNILALITLHRCQNVDEPILLRKFCDELFQLASTAWSQKKKIILLLHPRMARDMDIERLRSTATVILPPQPYRIMHQLVKKTEYVITDSGGLQRESYWAGTRCLVVRKDTEWTELKESDSASQVSIDKIHHTLVRDGLFKNSGTKLSVAAKRNQFGGGNAVKNIIKILKEFGIT